MYNNNDITFICQQERERMLLSATVSSEAGRCSHCSGVALQGLQHAQQHTGGRLTILVSSCHEVFMLPHTECNLRMLICSSLSLSLSLQDYSAQTEIEELLTQNDPTFSDN